MLTDYTLKTSEFVKFSSDSLVALWIASLDASGALKRCDCSHVDVTYVAALPDGVEG